MLLRIKQVRRLPDGKPGTDVDLTHTDAKAKAIVEFRPLDPKNPDVDHVAEVTDQQQIAKLLAIPDGFEIHKRTAAAAGVAEAGKSAEAPGAATSDAASAGIKPKMSKAELIEAVTKKTGKKPHPSTSTKKLQEVLAS